MNFCGHCGIELKKAPTKRGWIRGFGNSPDICYDCVDSFYRVVASTKSDAALRDECRKRGWVVLTKEEAAVCDYALLLMKIKHRYEDADRATHESILAQLAAIEGVGR